MSYERPISIKNALDEIIKKKYVLPSIQREYVWETDQIEVLFDSLMRGYPIGTFLFWQVEKTKIKDFRFNEFIREYHENNSAYPKAQLSEFEDVIGVLDGQQRLTSLYIALYGNYSEKRKHGRKNNADAYIKKTLYLNLLQNPEEDDKEFNFKFLTKEEACNTEKDFWFPCSEIIKFSKSSECSKFLMQNALMDSAHYTENQRNYAHDIIHNFWNLIHQKETINFFLEKDEDLDKVLQIFIRVNSGGTKLSYSDLLLSMATAEWKSMDAKEEITSYVKEINTIGNGFKFNKDLVLKTCLVLCDFKDIKFDVKNFNAQNMKEIEEKWDRIKTALKTSVTLLSYLGFNGENLLATNAVIPIAYFIYKNEYEQTILNHSERNNDRNAIKKWLALVLLKGVFGGQPDSIYPTMRKLINEHKNRFPLPEIIEEYKGSKKTLTFDDDSIEKLLDLPYGKAKTFFALTLLYPNLNYNKIYHQDHIHPKSLLTPKYLKEYGLNDEDIKIITTRKDELANIQLLEGTQNQEKSKALFKEWIEKQPGQRENYLAENYIAANQNLEIIDFISFIDARRQAIKTKLTELLKTG